VRQIKAPATIVFAANDGLFAAVPVKARSDMANPVLVEVTRSGRVESRHRGAVAVVDAAGRTLLALGDIEAAVYPRSAVKAIQAIPMVERGAADVFGFSAKELALAQASHGGEPAHVAGVAGMLAAIGLDETALECGSHAPSHRSSAEALVREGRPYGPLHNNCSGKHANFLALARHLGVDHRGYVHREHPVQQAVGEALASLTGVAHGAANAGIDGCSIPTYAVPLNRLALGFARLAAGAGMTRERAAAARRLYDAAVSEPFFVAGTGRFCTEVMALLKGEALVKTGAEGVFCAALGGLGLGIALKADDGETRAAEAMMAGVLALLLPQHSEALGPRLRRPINTRRGMAIGEVRPVEEAFRLPG
jgi:L-asparaginase II